MKWFLIEQMYVDSSVKHHIVQAKDYGEACVRIAKIQGDGDFKMLGMFEKSTIDPKIMNKIK